MTTLIEALKSGRMIRMKGNLAWGFVNPSYCFRLDEVIGEWEIEPDQDDIDTIAAEKCSVKFFNSYSGGCDSWGIFHYGFKNALAWERNRVK